MYEDTFRARQQNELKMQQEFNTIKVLRKCMNESKEQTNRMTGLLDNFEARLTGLHDLIMPVYDATNTLQIKYANLQKTVTELDKIIENYNSVKNLSLVIQAGPGKDISNYIGHLNKLKLAMDYFAVNKNQSLRKQNEDLWSLGKQNVDREFDQSLAKFNDSNLAASFDFDSDLDQTDVSGNGSAIFGRENDFR